MMNLRSPRSAIQPYPWPRLSLREAERARLRARPRTPLILEDPPLSLMLTGGPSAEAEPERLHLHGECGGAPFRLALPRGLIEALMREGDPEHDPAEMDAESGALLVELGLLPAIQALEARLGLSLALTKLAPAVAPGTKYQRLDAIVEGFGEAWPATLHAPPDLAAALEALWETQETQDSPAHAAASVTVAARIGASRLPRGAPMAVGDVVLVESFAPGRAALIVFGERAAAPGQFNPRGEVGATGPASFELARRYEELVMADASQGGFVADDATLDEIPVRLVFEVGRISLPWSELRGLGVGSAIPVSRAPDGAVDVMVEGRRIAQGQVVMIGESVGVRLTRIFS
ncbi:FliM/FliN family flagellar motor switch protein [Neomegalonema sp.]|uniref:FliM/FliN family flagellar motor switch protein n=1 Tax=Neomegalonema sp. TaxID=2039713 RepID=UPI002619CE52|nr:FliM/FliN family flagellar motor switch protein [Neomegalonema sp.]MDD2868170.1 FliM/FliN family flagellar motor switch protein [Neomegalonema sp.]